MLFQGIIGRLQYICNKRVALELILEKYGFYFNIQYSLIYRYTLITKE